MPSTLHPYKKEKGKFLQSNTYLGEYRFNIYAQDYTIYDSSTVGG